MTGSYGNVLALQQPYPAVRMMVRAPAFATRQPPTIVRTASLYRLNGIGNAGNMRNFTFVVISPPRMILGILRLDEVLTRGDHVDNRTVVELITGKGIAVAYIF